MGDSTKDEALELTGDVVRRRTGLAHPISHYCAIYDTTLRGIKVWIEKGRKNNDPPPLDDPAAMIKWWPRHSPQTVPGKLHQAAVRHAKTQSADTSAPSSAAAKMPPSTTGSTPPSPPPADPPPAPSRTTALMAGGEGMSLEQAMPTLQRVLAHVLKDYEDKAADPNADESSITLAANRLDKVIERHRKLETTLLESAQKRGELVNVSELRGELMAIFGQLCGSLVQHLIAHLGVDRNTATVCADEWFAGIRSMPFGDVAPLPDTRLAA